MLSSIIIYFKLSAENSANADALTGAISIGCTVVKHEIKCIILAETLKGRLRVFKFDIG